MKIPLVVLTLLASCTHKLPELQSPTLNVDIPPPPKAVRIITQAAVTRVLSYVVEIAEDVCADGTCIYQLKNDAEPNADWRDCIDASCANLGTQFTFALQNLAVGPLVNRLHLRTRTEGGLVSTDDFVEITTKVDLPPVPTKIRLSAADRAVFINWSASLQNVTGFLVYYGSEPATSGDFSKLNAVFATEGPSPVFVPVPPASTGDMSFALTGIPNGTPVYVGITAVDATNTEGLALFPIDARKQFATPGEFAMRFVNEVVSPAPRQARAVAAQGDLVALVSTEVGKTVVELYDLAALTNAGSGPLGSLTLNDSANAMCPDRKQVIFFDRYLFVSSGTGNVFAIDVIDPRHPAIAFSDVSKDGSDVFSASKVTGCATSLQLAWPWLFIASGTNASGGKMLYRKLSLQPAAKIGVSAESCQAFADCDSSGPGGTARVVTLAHSGSLPGRFFMSNPSGVFECTVDLNDGSTSCPLAGPGSFFPTNGFVSDLDPAVMRFEPPLLFVPRGPEAPTGAGSLRIYRTNDAGGAQQKVIDLDLPQRVRSMTASGKYLFVGETSARGVDVVDVSDEEAPRVVGVFGGKGDIRDLAMAGPYLLAVDDAVGLVVVDTAQSSVLVNSGAAKSAGVPSIRGLRSWISDVVRDFPRVSLQSLRNLVYVPIPAQGGAGEADRNYCFLSNEDHGRIACGARRPQNHLNGYDSSPFSVRPCLLAAASPVPQWPMTCFGTYPGDPNGEPRTVRSLTLSGPELLFAYMRNASDPSVRIVSLTDVATFAPSTDTVDATLRPLGAAPTLAATLAVAPGLAAVQTEVGVTLIGRADRTAPTVGQSIAGLRGAAFGVDDVCGVRFENDFASVRCLDRATLTETKRLDIGNVKIGDKRCDEAAITRNGSHIAVALMASAGGKVECEGVHVFDLAADGRRTSFALDVVLPSLRVDGPYVYVPCDLGVCQLRLRR